MAPKFVLGTQVFVLVSWKRTIRFIIIVRTVLCLKVLGNNLAVTHFKMPQTRDEAGYRATSKDYTHQAGVWVRLYVQS